MGHVVKDKIKVLEGCMRPGHASYGGFLGENESLAEVLAADDATVQRLGVTHGQIADRLEYFVKKSCEWKPESISSKPRITVDGKYLMDFRSYRGYQNCPWRDKAEYNNRELKVENTELGEAVSFPGLIVHLIRKHNFYEGRESPYRVDPEQVIRILEIK